MIINFKMNRISWVILLLLILAISTIMQLAAVEFSDKYDYNGIDYLIIPGSTLVTGLLLLYILLIPVFDYTSRWSTLTRLIILLLFGIFYSIIFILIMHLFPALISDKPSDYQESIINFAYASFHNVIKNYFFQIAILFAYEYIYKEKSLAEKQKNLEIELNNTKLQILKSQLQPHFLFNALNGVVAEMEDNTAKAQEILINISDLLRTSLSTDFLTPIPIKDEIELIIKYLSIEKMRYADQLNFTINMDDDMREKKIPVMILQPLVENAIKHGFKNIEKPLVIIIDIKNNRIMVRNNGCALKQNIPKIGLQNVTQRMEIFNKNFNSFQIYQDGNWVVNKLEIA